MNNPFSRLKHYSQDIIDPQENHATECLAACLVFSPTIRRSFIGFLSDKIQMDLSTEIEVDTQQTIEGGFIDLILQQQDHFLMAVEVKIKSPENCEHHCKQLKTYRTWLDNKIRSKGYLFTLVRSRDKTFNPQKHGANGRYTWRELYNYFQKTLKNHFQKTAKKTSTLSETEVNLIKNLCDYLESEGIVITFDTKDLLNYAEGFKARDAINGIFQQVASKLEENGFETRTIEGSKNRLPELKISHKRWKHIFGKGENWKISLWFCVPGIWGEKEYAFAPSIELWDIGHHNDWKYTKPKLPKWLKTLKLNKFNWEIYASNWNNFESNLAANKIQSEPKRIFVQKKGVEINEGKLKATDTDTLVSKLVGWVIEHAKVIESLEP